MEAAGLNSPGQDLTNLNRRESMFSSPAASSANRPTPGSSQQRFPLQGLPDYGTEGCVPPHCKEDMKVVSISVSQTFVRLRLTNLRLTTVTVPQPNPNQRAPPPKRYQNRRHKGALE